MFFLTVVFGRGSEGFFGWLVHFVCVWGFAYLFLWGFLFFFNKSQGLLRFQQALLCWYELQRMLSAAPAPLTQLSDL